MKAPSPALRILAAVAAGGVLVGRPHGVVHVHAGPLTRSGRAVPAAARPLCGTRSRRLRVLVTRESTERLQKWVTVSADGDPDADLVITSRRGPRRFCRTCVAMLPTGLGGGSEAPVTREDWIGAYGDLTAADLHLAALWARTEGETYQVHDALMKVHGAKPAPPHPRQTTEQLELTAAYDAVFERRAAIKVALRTEDEVAALRGSRSAADHNRRLAEKARRHEIRLENAQERARKGSFPKPGDRELLDSA